MARWSVPEIVLNDAKNSYAVGNYFTSEDFKKTLVRKTYSYSYITPHYYDSEGEEVETCATISEATANFFEDFSLWLSSRLPQFDRIYSAINLEYEPIENYARNETWTQEKHKGSMEEYAISDSDTGTDTAEQTGTVTHDKSGTETGTETTDRTGTDTHAKNGTETGTETTTETGTDNHSTTGTEVGTVSTNHTGTDTASETSSGNNTASVYGFNGTDASPSDTSTVSGTTEKTETRNLTDAETRDITTGGKDEETKNLKTVLGKDLASTESDTETVALKDAVTKDLTNTEKDTETVNTKNTETKNLKHEKTGTTKFSDQSATVFDKDVYINETHGNIGVTTSQHMLESELKLRDLIDFKNYIVQDFCRRVLVIGVIYNG